jgi:superfamily II DNA or RNA helicase
MKRQALRGSRASNRVLLQLPTGGGKTVIFSHIASSSAAKRKRVIIAAHRMEIIGQISGTLTRFRIEHDFIEAGKSISDHPIKIASIATLARRIEKGHKLDDIDLLVIDEAHHVTAESWRTVIKAARNARVLGVSATPLRLDGKGLGEIFDTLICGPSTAELTEAGYLSPAIVYAPETRPDLSGIQIVGGDYDMGSLSTAMGAALITGNAVSHYGRLCRGTPAVAFCCDIRHSKAVAQSFRDAGYRAAHLDGQTAAEERRALIAALGSGELDVLTNCGIISEGIDVPIVGAAILLRPTRSLALYLQMVGRVLRPAPGKTRAIILDHAGNFWEHGLPDDPRHWSLEGQSKKTRPMAAANPFRHCETLRLRQSACGLAL